MKKTIALHGAYFIDNFGDALFMELFKSWIEDDVEVVVPFACEKIRKELKFSEKKGIKALMNSSGVIFTGGGYFGERKYKRLKWNIRFMIYHGFLGCALRLLKKPYIIVGVGAGPITNIFIRKIIGFILAGAQKISVRDIQSYEFIKTLKINMDKVEVTTDSALLYDTDELKKNSCSLSKKILIHLDKAPSQSKKMTLLLEGIREYYFGKNVEIYLITDTVDSKNQLLFIEEGKQIFEGMSLNVNYYNSPKEMVKFLSEMNLIITTKLHIGILGVKLKKNVLSFSNHIKIQRFYQQINKEDRCLKIEDLTSEKLRIKLEEYSVFKDDKIVLDEEIMRKAYKNKQMVKSFIK